MNQHLTYGLLAYLMFGFIIGGARSYFSRDVFFLYAIIWPINSFFLFLLRPRREERPILHIHFPSIYSPYAEAFGFAFFASAILLWRQHGDEIEAIVRELLR